METYNTILADDKSIITHSSQYACIYNIVKAFIDDNHLEQRKIGSVIDFWLSVDCPGDTRPEIMKSYHFIFNVTEDLCEHMTSLIITLFKGCINKLINCKLTLSKGV